MKNHARSLVPLLCVLLAACQQTSIAEQERISGAATIQAATPSVTPTLAPTATPEPTATLTPSPGPTSTPVPPTATPPPPTATPNAALSGFSLCTQSAGDLASGRFSAQLTAITVTAGLESDRLTLALDVPGTSVAPHAVARCLQNEGALTLRLELPDWLHDARFASSALTRTLELSGTSGLSAPRFEVSPGDAGAALLLTLASAKPFKLSYQTAPPQIQIDIARSAPATADPLTQPSGDPPKAAAPIFYLQTGDLWSLVDGKATNLTNSAETETALAVAPSGKQVVFCRAAPGTDASDLGAASDLWVQDVGGAAKRISPDSARTCAEPVYSPDGTTVAFTVSETAANPPRFAIYTVTVSDGAAKRVTSPNDEWSRFGPQWLADGKLVYAASAEDGRSALFSRTPDGREDDIAAKLVVGDRYRAIGRPLVSRDGSLIAVEGLRVGSPGADLLLLDPTGAEKQTVGGSYWARPLAWSADGTLFYLTSSCASEAAQSYELRARPSAGSERTLATGLMAGSIGQAAAVGGGLAYVAQSQAGAGPRGPLASAAGAGALWLWDLSGGGRARLLESPGPIGAVGAGA